MKANPTILLIQQFETFNGSNLREFAIKQDGWMDKIHVRMHTRLYMVTEQNNVNSRANCNLTGGRDLSRSIPRMKSLSHTHPSPGTRGQSS